MSHIQIQSYCKEKNNNETIFVFDLGGGTFDVSILDVGEGLFEVAATSGDINLGGDNFDEKIVQWLIQEFKVKEGIEVNPTGNTIQRLMDAAEKAKVELSSLNKTIISLPFMHTSSDGIPTHFEIELTRKKFDELCLDLIERCKIPIQESLKDAGKKTSQIDQTVLVGGSTRILAVQQLVKNLLGKSLNQTVNPDEVVAIGAVVQGGILG